MADPLFLAAAGSASLAALSIVAAAGLRGWKGWLELKRAEIVSPDRPPPGRSEVAALRERIRKLEAIADGTGGSTRGR